MKLRPTNPFLLAAASFAATATTLFAAQAHAQVMQVEDDGTVRARTGAGVVDWNADDAAAPESTEIAAAALTLPRPTAPAAFAASIARASATHGISPSLLEALIWQESRWRPNAVSSAGARGLTQLMPATARELGVDPRDPAAAIEGGALYLRRQLDRFGGDVERALAAYNAGPARVLRAGGVPRIAETRAYVTAILNRLSQTMEK